MSKGAALALISAGVFAGYLTLTGRWPAFLLAILYPEAIQIGGG